MPDESPLAPEALREVARAPLVRDGNPSSPGFWESRYAGNPDVSRAALEGESVLLNLKNGVYYGLNRIGTVVWDLLMKEQSLETVLAAVRARYDVSEEVARADVAALVTQLRDEGLIVERR
jgi:hypothetical protein